MITKICAMGRGEVICILILYLSLELVVFWVLNILSITFDAVELNADWFIEVLFFTVSFISFIVDNVVKDHSGGVSNEKQFNIKDNRIRDTGSIHTRR